MQCVVTFLMKQCAQWITSQTDLAMTIGKVYVLQELEPRAEKWFFFKNKEAVNLEILKKKYITQELPKLP